MALAVAVLGVLFSAGQFVVSVIALRRGGVPWFPAGGPDNVDEKERSLRKWALQGMLVASFFLFAAAFAYLLARPHYCPYDTCQDVYNRQRGIGHYGRLFAFAALASSVAGWALWSRTRTWQGEILLAVWLAVLSVGLILAFYDLPVLTQEPPSQLPGGGGF